MSLTFVWTLAGGVILRNVRIFAAIDVFGNASLSLYLAMALLSLKLWQLSDLAGPLVVILGAQTLTMAFVFGWGDAAVLSAGHCGFGWAQPHCRQQLPGVYYLFLLFGVSSSTSTELQTSFMLIFFASIKFKFKKL